MTGRPANRLRLQRRAVLRVLLLAVPCLLATQATAATIPFTVTMSEVVNVTGVPQIAIDVGGVPKVATYQSGSGTNTLTFGYQVQPGDFDGDGITLTPTIDLNSGSITDLAGNSLNPSFTLSASTANIKVQTYTVAFTTSPVTPATATTVGFSILNAPSSGATYSYTITSSGGPGAVSGSGNVTASTMPVTADVSGLLPGTLALGVTISKTGQGTGQEKQATVSANVTFSGRVLDALSTSAAAAYSTRLLSSAYTGPLLRVRRASDNAVRDIGVGIGGGLATANLIEFCANTSCFVPTWYDQSGNGRDATQGTASTQPRIVNAGTLEKVNTRPAIKSDGVDHQMTFALGPLVSYPISLNLVLGRTSVSERGSWVKLGGLTANSGGIAIGVGDGSRFFNVGSLIVALKETVVWMSSSTALAASAVITFTQDATASSTAIFQNGASVAVSNAASAPLAPNGPLGYLFGHAYFNGEQRWSNDSISEIILLPSLLSTTARQSLEANQKDWYGTP